MKKLILTTLLSMTILAGCTQNDTRVPIYFGDSGRTEAIRWTQYNDLVAKVAEGDNFIVVITNQTCSCTTDFLPILNDYIEAKNIEVFLLEYSLILYQVEKYGLPVTNVNSPLIGIYEEGTLKNFKAYVAGDTTKNRPFTNYDAFVTYLEELIMLPKFKYISLTELNALFAGNSKFIIYYGRVSCPDCTYVLATFWKRYVKENRTMPIIYGLDVEVQGLWNATDGSATVGWTDFKNSYGMSNVINELGYSTGYVPTFQYIEANGSLPQNDMSVVKDMCVVYNDSTSDAVGKTGAITRSFFDGTRTLGYTSVNLIGTPLVYTTRDEYHELIAVYHEPLIEAFFDLYLPQVD